MKKSNAKKIAFSGILSALAIVLSIFESFLPAVPYMPPGAKLGLSNIVTMFAAAEIGLPAALTIAVVKSLFVFVTRGFSAFCMSISGGVLSTIVMWLFFKYLRNIFGYWGIGIFSAMAHNMGQVVAASILLGSTTLYKSIPVLMIFSVATGLLTGTVLKLLMPAINKFTKRLE